MCSHTWNFGKKHHTTSSHMELKSEMECIVHVVEQWMNISMWNNMESWHECNCTICDPIWFSMEQRWHGIADVEWRSHNPVRNLTLYWHANDSLHRHRISRWNQCWGSFGAESSLINGLQLWKWNDQMGATYKRHPEGSFEACTCVCQPVISRCLTQLQ